MLDKNNIFITLNALGEHIAAISSESVDIVICGGSALQLLNLVDRTTRDIDVLAILRSDENNSPILATAEPFPDILLDAARNVAEDLNLPNNWINPGPTGLLSEGLPEGCMERLHPISFGEKLTIHVIDRLDQVCFKMYATVNGGDLRHLTDLKALNPTEDELVFAAKWTITQDAADFFPDIVKDFLNKVGYGNVIDRI